MNSQELSFEQKGHSELEKKNNGRNGPSETKKIIEILSEIKKFNTEMLAEIEDIESRLVKNNNSVSQKKHKNKTESLLGGRAGIDYDTLPGHIIIRDGEGGGYIMKEKNEGISKKNPDGGYYTFDEAQNVAPKGYHIPSSKEWKGLYKLGIKLGLWEEDNGKMFSYKLKLPFSGRRIRDDGSVYYQGSYGAYWSSSLDDTYARLLSFDSSRVSPQNSSHRVNGFSVRCFKNY